MIHSSENPVYSGGLAYLTTAALTAGVKLDIFTTIGDGAKTPDALAKATNASARGMRILCDYLTAIGLLEKEGSEYRLAPASKRNLDNTSPMAVGETLDFLAAPEMIALALDDPVSYIRNGGSTGLAHIASDNPIWVRFAHAMVPYARVTAKRVAAYVEELPKGICKVLDVAAGHGLYGIEAARVLPQAIVTAVDWADVLATANVRAKAAGIYDRYRPVEGSAFEVAWGDNFDLVLLPNLLHHFGHQECVGLLRKIRASLSPSGRVLIIEFVPNEDRVSPPLQAMFAFLMLATTPNGDAYTLNDLRKIASEAGFDRVTSRRLAPTPETLVILEA
jgi:2-polyprenyl-3-methyl-5-hydroxy-6-metoxy-1,4-benzoquinol methylase